MSIALSCQQQTAAFPIVSWAERRIARERGAMAFLRSRGFNVSIANIQSTLPTYWVSGYVGQLIAADVVLIAERNGFAG